MLIELNIDLGELPNEPEELYRLAHRVNIACGGHAGDAASMLLACRRAAATGAKIGAHPSYPDRTGFGRRRPQLSDADLQATLEDQCDALNTATDDTGTPIVHVKPHGALYHDASQDPALADLVVAAAYATLGEIEIIGPPGGALEQAAREANCTFLAEGFADRGYAADGGLLPRGAAGALIEDPEQAAAQAVRLAKSGLYQTLCVHSDTPNAVAIARAVRAALDAL